MTATYSPVTVEAEYSLGDTGQTHHWTFSDRTPTEAHDYVVGHCVPLDATLFRVGVWSGTPADRPESGHEPGLLDD